MWVAELLCKVQNFVGAHILPPVLGGRRSQWLKAEEVKNILLFFFDYNPKK